MINRFYCVIGEIQPRGLGGYGGKENVVTVSHPTEDAARQEAERLAKKEKRPFYVMEAIAQVAPSTPPVEWTELLSYSLQDRTGEHHG